MAVDSRFFTRFFVPQDRESLEALYRSVYKEAWQQKTNLAWTVDRTSTNAGALIAVEKGSQCVVAAQPFCDLPLHTQKGSRVVTLFLDVATHPAYQRRGLFARVVSSATTAAFERGSSIIMTTPNHIAFQGFKKLPGWVQLCSLDCMVLPLGMGNSARAVKPLSLVLRTGIGMAALLISHRRRIAKGLSGQTNGHPIEAPWIPGNESELLWRRFAPRINTVIERTSEFIKWRFRFGYRLFLARDTHGPLAYVAVRVIEHGGIKVGVIVDYVPPNDDRSAIALLGYVIAWLKEQQVSAAISYLRRKSVAWLQLRAAGFVRLPRMCVPRDYPVCVSVKPGDPDQATLLDPFRWHLSLADSDLV